jgi:hypothetical protein
VNSEVRKEVVMNDEWKGRNLVEKIWGGVDKSNHSSQPIMKSPLMHRAHERLK